MEIKKVIITGLGAIGLTYADKLKNICELKILADRARVEKYKKNPPMFNGEETAFDYILPEDIFSADLIIISTKNNGLAAAAENIKNFVSKNTIIISLINGISSENKLIEKYGKDKVLHSYFIGHSAMRDGNKVIQDGVGKIVFGSPYPENIEKVNSLKKFFSENNIDYENPEDIIYSLWLKYTLNSFSNQLSALLNMNFGEMKRSSNFRSLAKSIISEIIPIAEREGVNNPENLEADSFKALDLMIDDGETSMLQDFHAGRKSEVDIFSGELIRLGEKYSVPTPFSKVVYTMIKAAEEGRERCSSVAQ